MYITSNINIYIYIYNNISDWQIAWFKEKIWLLESFPHGDYSALYYKDNINNHINILK